LSQISSIPAAREWQIQIQWELGATIPVHKAIGEDNIKTLISRAKAQMGKEINLTVDWKFLTNAKFLSLSPLEIEQKILLITHQVRSIDTSSNCIFLTFSS